MNSKAANRRDLIALVADRDIQAVLLALLKRPGDLGIRRIDVVPTDVPVHHHHDPGCLRKADEFLRPFHLQYSHALVVFDREGCGQDQLEADRIESEVELRLARSGWESRATAVVVDPEVEMWVWSDSPYVESCLAWTGRQPRLRIWLEKQDLWPAGEAKPPNPKRAFRAALREARRSLSSAVFGELAAQVEFSFCSDRAFCKLRETLRTWFPRD